MPPCLNYLLLQFDLKIYYFNNSYLQNTRQRLISSISNDHPPQYKDLQKAKEVTIQLPITTVSYRLSLMVRQ